MTRNTVVRIVNHDGDIYEATRSGPDQAWEINWPEGSDRFYGTEATVRSHIKRLIALGHLAKVAAR